MSSELFVDVQAQEIAIALTEDHRLQEVNREKRDQDTYAVGNIYYGRVKKVMPALNAVFVDVGYEKEGFLHYLDLGSEFRTLQAYTTKAVSDRRRVPDMAKVQRQPEVGKEGQIADVLKVGDTLLVQVTKEPINTKGPRLTAEISIAGRNMVLMPFADKVMVSSKIRKESERGRLKQLVNSVRPKGYGVIVRTVAEGKRVAELDGELSLLVKRWEDAVRRLQRSQPIALICEEMGRTIGILRDMLSPSFTDIWVNEEETYNEVRQYLGLVAPESVEIVKLYKGEQPMFDKFDITRQMKTGLGRTVGFPKGGYLIIDKTEALFSIDVNSGSKKIFDDQEENAFQYNMLAAEEIAHQLRLRDIGGIIIVDFIDMDDQGHQNELYSKMRQLMSRDRAKHNVLPLSKFGLMQITRQRVRPAVEVEVQETCPTCGGKGKIQPSFLFHEQMPETIARMTEHYGTGLRLHVHPYLYAYINRGWIFSERAKMERRYGIRIICDQSVGMLQLLFQDKQGNPLEEPKSENTKTEKRLKFEEPKKEQPKPQPKKEEPKPQPKKEEPKPQPKKEQPKPQPKKEQPKPEVKPEVKPEEPKAEEQPKAEKPKRSKPKRKPAKAAEPKAEEPKTETKAEPQTEAPKAAEPQAENTSESAPAEQKKAPKRRAPRKKKSNGEKPSTEEKQAE